MSDDDDPLWLNSPIKLKLFHAACYALPIALMMAVMAWITGSARGVVIGAVAVLVGLIAARGWIGRLVGAAAHGLRARSLQAREGRHYNFAGVDLSVHDDGHLLWLHEGGLRRLLGLDRDPEQAFKARFSGHWRESAELGLKGRGLWLNAAAVHRLLADAPERMDPKRVRLRGYIDREILQPAARRHARR